MANWLLAMQQRIEEERDFGLPRHQIINEEFFLGSEPILLKAYHPQAGSIAYFPESRSYTVTNEHTFKTHTSLALDAVEQALTALDIANSDWR